MCCMISIILPVGTCSWGHGGWGNRRRLLHWLLPGHRSERSRRLLVHSCIHVCLYVSLVLPGSRHRLLRRPGESNPETQFLTIKPHQLEFKEIEEITSNCHEFCVKGPIFMGKYSRGFKIELMLRSKVPQNELPYFGIIRFYAIQLCIPLLVVFIYRKCQY